MVTPAPAFVDLHVHVTPRASKDACAGVANGEVRIRLRAPPVDGAANAALLTFMSAALRTPRSSLELRRGGTSRHKCLRIHGLSLAAVEAALGLPIPTTNP